MSQQLLVRIALAAFALAPCTAALAAVYCLLPVGFKLTSAALAWRWRHTLEESP